MSLHCLGAERVSEREVSPWRHVAVSVGAGALGALLWPSHRVLGFLGAATLGEVGSRFQAGDIDAKRAARMLGTQVVATAGSLSLQSHPAIGYVAGKVTAGFFVDEPVIRVSFKPEAVETKALAKVA